MNRPRKFVQVSISLSLITALGVLLPALPMGTHQVGALGTPSCRDGQLSVSGVNGGGAAVTWSWIIRYRNVSPVRCTLSGYPTVVGLIGTVGVRLAQHELNGYMGGWTGASSSGKQKPPTVTLRARTGVASSMIEVTSASASGTCPHLTSLWVKIPGGARPWVFSVRIVDCSNFSTNPFVPGSTGRAS